MTVVMGMTSLVCAQRPRFESPLSAPPLVPVPPSYGVPQATLGSSIQPFDPYALPAGPYPGGAAAVPNPLDWPYASPSPLQGGISMPPFSQPPLSPNGWNPYGTPPASPYGTPIPGNPWGSGGGATPYGAPANASGGLPYQRLFQDTGFRYTWLYGKQGADLSLNEVEVSTTAYFPNFFRGRFPLRVTPGFAVDWTDGPSLPVTSAVPPRLYAAYLELGWDPQFSERWGAEFSLRTGLYTDFQTLTNDSLRFIGTGVGLFRVTPNTVLKLGGAFIDRAKIKFLPAVGILWEPNPQTRWDIFFPAPKLSNYWTTVGNTQVWWYLGGEYGGGSWTIERQLAPHQGASERIDINDIRFYLGLEWWNLNRYYGFFEAGYVFNRELIYTHYPPDTVDLNHTFMLRAGLSF